MALPQRLRWLYEPWVNIIATAGAAVAFALTAAFTSKTNAGFWISISAGVFLTVASSVLQILSRRSLKSVGRELGRAEQDRDAARGSVTQLEETLGRAQDAVDGIAQRFLHQVSEQHGLTVEERITMFVRDGSGLRLVGRYASAPQYLDLGDRSYPEGHGLMWRAVERGQKETISYTGAAEDEDAYKRWQRSEGRLTVRAIQALTMRSRLYFVVPVRDPEGLSAIGGCVIESMKPTCVQVDRLATALDTQGSSEKRIVADLMTVFAQMWPMPPTEE